MKMCYNAYELPVALNAIFSFLIMICSTLLFSDEVLSESILVPVKSDDVNDASLLGIELDGDSVAKSIQKRHHPSSNTAWFGPRLGRRKRSIILDEDFFDLLEDHNQKNSADDDVQLIKHPITLPLIIEGYMSKRQYMKPRLGRGNSWSDDDDKMVKAPPFSPRLGRRSLVPLKPRLGRAGTSPETAVFKPRLGRDPNFNEFNEYADTRNSVEDKDH